MMSAMPQMRRIEVKLSDDEWAMEEAGAEALVREMLEAVEAHAGPLRAGVLEVWFAKDEEVRDLNNRFRGQDKATNVLSFASPPLPPIPQNPQMAHFGQLALAHGVCKTEALVREITLLDHARHLVLHGLLHLQGYDHEAEEEAQKMEAVERTIMKTLKLHDPYVMPGDVRG